MDGKKDVRIIHTMQVDKRRSLECPRILTFNQVNQILKSGNVKNLSESSRKWAKYIAYLFPSNISEYFQLFLNIGNDLSGKGVGRQYFHVVQEYNQNVQDIFTITKNYLLQSNLHKLK